MKKVSVTMPQSGSGWGTIKTKYPPHSLFVRADELTGGSKNFDSNTKGSLTKRSGGVSYGTIPTANKDQFEAIFTDGVHHLLIVESGNLRYSSGGGTFTLVTAGYSSVGNFEFAVYQDRVYFDNGIDSPQVYDRTTSYGGVSYTAPQTKVMGAQAPGSAVTFAADTAGGNVPAGGHTYKVTFLYYDSEESNGGTASAVHTVANPNNTVNLTAVPVGGYGVTARKIYRDDNDGVYRLVGTISNNTATTFTDTASTGTALIPTDHNVPPTFKYIQTHLDRTWIAGISGGPSYLNFSEAGLPDIFPSTNTILCNPEDPITGIFVFNDRVYVFNRNSMGQILGRTRDQFYYSAIPSAVGCVDNRSIRIRTIEGVPELMWLSDKGFYGTNGSTVEYLSDPIEDLVNLNIQQAAQVRGQNSQTTQAQFQGGTASPGIDLTTTPGTITTPNPKRIWDDEADWEGGSSLTNIATNDGTNTLKVPTKHAPAFSSGTHSNTQESAGSLVLGTSTDFTGESSLPGHLFLGGGLTTGSGGNSYVAQKLIATRAGTLTAASIRVLAGASGGTLSLVIWDSLGGQPNTILHESGSVVVGAGATTTISTSPSISLAAGQTFWIGMHQIAAGGNSCNVYIGDVALSGGTDWLANSGSGWVDFGPGVKANFPQMALSYTFVSTPIASSGLWTGPIYDSFSDSAVPDTISHTGSFPAGTSSVTTVEASNISDLSSGITSQTFNNLNGSSSVSTTNKRYWRVKIQLATSDDRLTPTIGAPTLKFSTTGTWISEAIDHTTDITALTTLSMVSSTPAGTTAALEIATSANNIAYTAFGSLGSAVVQRYSKIRVTLTTTGDNLTSPSVTSVTFKWTMVSNLISSAIDTGNTPAGWDIFQAQYAENGGTLAFYMRSATTSPGLSAASFVAVTNGAFPSVAVNRFVQWKVIITSTADAVPTVDSVTINWFISQTTSIRVASIFYNKTYYLAAAEYNQTSNNLIVAYDFEGKWRTYRGINVATLSYFFNEPYYGSATEGRIVRFLSSGTNTDLGTPIEMVVESKAIDFGDTEHTKIGRKLYIKGKNTGAVYQVYMSFDGGLTYNQMLDVLTGLTSFTTLSDGGVFYRRFQLDFNLGNATAGKTISWKIVESTTAAAQIDAVKVESWIRSGELVA